MIRQLPTKHLNREITDLEDQEISDLAEIRRITYLQAKHIYFENKDGLGKWIQ